MKYSQYIELEETLAEKGHTVKEFQIALNEGLNDDKLYEFFGINKALLSWGVKGILTRRLKKQAEKFIDDSKETITSSIRKLVRTKNKVKDQIQEIQKADKPVPQKAYEQIILIEKKIIKTINDSVDKLAAIKTEQIETRIDQSKKLKESAKIGLKYHWEKLITDGKIDILTKLMEQKIIESEQTIKLLRGAFSKEEEKLKVKAKGINAKIKAAKEERGDDEGEGEKKGEEL